MAEDGATQQGVSKRDQDMELILKQREADYHEEFGDEVEDENILKNQLTDSVEDIDKIPEEAMVSFKGSDGTEYLVPVSATANLKIDGEEINTPIDQMTQRYQKGAAGDRRLQQANDLKQELMQKEKALSEREQQFLEQMNTAKSQQTSGDLSSDDYKEKVRELIEAVVDADEEKAVDLFASIHQQPAQIDPDQLEQTITSKVKKTIDNREASLRQAKYNKKLTDANAKFEKDYADLVSDQYLYDMVNNETAKLVRETPEADPWEIISAAADTVRKWHSGIAKTNTKGKRSSVTPVSGRVSIGQEEKPPPTRSDIINSMRADRGQPAI